MRRRDLVMAWAKRSVTHRSSQRVIRAESMRGHGAMSAFADPTVSSAFHALVTSPISAISGSRIADGVREKRGAGAGCVTPWRSTNTLRAAMCGCFGASAMVRIGAKQMSVPSMILHQSSRVLLLNTFVSFSFSAGHALRSICASKSASVRSACLRSSA